MLNDTAPNGSFDIHVIMSQWHYKDPMLLCYIKNIKNKNLHYLKAHIRRMFLKFYY